MRIELPDPHINQQKILDSNARFRVVMAGRRFGKSELSQIEIIVNALQGKQVFYVTPTYNLARVFFDQLAKAVPFEANKSELSIKFPNGGAVYFFTGERLDNLRGRKFHFGVIDEASFIPDLENGWLNSIRPTLTDYKGRALFISTPKGKNFFYSLFLKSGEPDWESFKFTTYDNPYIDKTEIDDARLQLPEVVFEQEYLANPAENASNPFGSSYIKQCRWSFVCPPASTTGRKVCTGRGCKDAVNVAELIKGQKAKVPCRFYVNQTDVVAGIRIRLGPVAAVVTKRQDGFHRAAIQSRRRAR